MKEISTGQFLRIMLMLIFVGISYIILNYLGGVLLPFLVAWLLAYLLYPIVTFFQYKLRMRYRMLSIIAVLLSLLVIIVGILMLVVPSLISELGQLKNVVIDIVSNRIKNPSIPPVINNIIQEYANDNGLSGILQSSGVQDMIKSLVQKTWFFAMGTINVVIQVIASCIAILYLFFILLDYERLAEEWQTLLPPSWRDSVNALTHDLTEGMNQYFRGQALIAISVGVMYATAFSIIGIPLGILMGLFVGLLSMIPYMQLVSIIPTTFICLIMSVNGNVSFWIIWWNCILAYAIIQSIEDLYLTPKIMGKAMGLNPAIILLSLSIWGALLGLIGMIIALPMTTLLISYYKRYIIDSPDGGNRQERQRAISSLDSLTGIKF